MTDDPKDAPPPSGNQTDMTTVPPVAAQQPSLPFPPAFGPAPGSSMTFGLQVTNAEAELIKKVTPEHITTAMQNTHERELRRIDLAEKELEDSRAEADRRHQRDERMRSSQAQTDNRYERILYVLLFVVAIAGGVLVAGGKPDDAYRLFTDFLKVALGFVGGIGIANARQKRKESDSD